MKVKNKTKKYNRMRVELEHLLSVFYITQLSIKCRETITKMELE